MKSLVKSLPLILFSTFYISLCPAQNFVGKWKYQVLNTVSGDYFGTLEIEQIQDDYSGFFKTSTGLYPAKITLLSGDSLLINAGVEGFITSFIGQCKGDTLTANVHVLGDENNYLFTAVRTQQSSISIQLIDDDSKEVIPYAHIKIGELNLLANDLGQFNLKSSLGKQLLISAIGYENKTLEIDWKTVNDSLSIHLTAAQYKLPTVNVSAKGFRAKDIVKAAINRITDNYIQNAYNSNLFFRYSVLGHKDSLLYQSESILKFYDSKGYQKRPWRRAAATRFAEIRQGRILVGKTKQKLKLEELGNIFVFWAHEPIVTFDKPLSLRSVDAYEYKLLGIREFAGTEVYEISFNSKTLKEQFTGLPALTFFKGKLYINKADYAVLRYELKYEMDYSFKNKATKKRWGGNIRRVINADITEVFSKHKDHYVLNYVKSDKSLKFQEIKEDGSTKDSFTQSIEEYQFFDFATKNISVLNDNLFKLDNKTKYDPTFWSQFNLISQ